MYAHFYSTVSSLFSEHAGCPEDVYQMMMSCWQMDDKERPTFAMLESKIKTLLAKEKKGLSGAI